jgi:excinuclease UvrABC nuclease subunit
MEEIREFFEGFGDPELTESSEELQALEAWADEIRRDRPLGLKQRLSEQLREAISQERYEQAARLRDRLREIESASS